VECLEGRWLPAPVAPVLNSNPGAKAVLYLDFDGHKGPNADGTTVTTPAFDTDGDPTTFNASEQAAIKDVWRRVAEDFAPFNINVTTVDPGIYFPRTSLRVAIGGSWSDWFGKSAGGLGWVGLFANPNASNAARTVFVFAKSQGNDPRAIAEAASQEAGHAFGLEHQSSYDAAGNKTAEYNPGTPLKAPIMGNSYTASRGIWWMGPNTVSATTIQDDMAVIGGAANGFGFRADDHGNTSLTADALWQVGNTLRGSGIIEKTSDTDYFRFTTSAAGTVWLYLNADGWLGHNLQAVVELRSSSNALLAWSDPVPDQGVVVSTDLAAGTYFVAVRSHGDYGDVGQYTLTGYTPNSVSPISAKFAALGGYDGFLGGPVSDEVPAADGVGRFRDFQGGSIYWSPATGAHEVHGVILAKYKSLGAERSPLGYPTSDEQAAANGGRVSFFQNSAIYFNAATSTAFEVHGLIWNKYNSMGRETSVLGYPVSDEQAANNGRWSQFQGGAIFYNGATNATFEVHGLIWNKYNSLGRETSFLGYPISNEQAAANGGRWSQFEHGAIFYNAATNTTNEVHGLIWNKYNSMGRETSFLGYPTSDESAANNGRVSFFQGGAIFYNGATNATFEVHGAIWNKYNSLGRETSFLGYPISDPQAAANNGLWSQFEHGGIFYNPANGATFEVHGLIWNKYLSLGREVAFMGYPLSDELQGPGPGRYSLFQGGGIFYHPTYGTHEVRGLIWNTYNSLGRAGSSLGYPVTDQLTTPNGVGLYNNFVFGSITWSPSAGVVATDWQLIGHANSVVAMTGLNGKLYAVTSDSNMWMRDPVTSNVDWTWIGHAYGVTAMTALNGQLYAVTSDNNLWVRDPVPYDVNWTWIGHAYGVTALAALNGQLYAATSDNLLWVRDPVPYDVNWTQIGHANNVVSMTAQNGQLIAATSDNVIWARDPVPYDVNWTPIDHANNRVVGLGVVNGALFAATADDQLWIRATFTELSG
jgi:uncharacterized protein with LGFP repeats